ncbi:MAG: DNA recombination protein RmuC [Bdellovibrionales bacterium]
MSGSEIVLFLMGFVLGSGFVFALFRFRSQSEQSSKEVFQQQFQLLAHQILDEKTRKLDEVQQKNLQMILDPLKERLKDFEKKVDETYSQERSERGVLKGELNKLLELNQVMSKEAQSLSRALKGDVKTQGNWGEMILENILQRSGLREGEEYTAQGTDLGLKSEEGGRLLPDIVVKLPGGKHLIVDSKVSLKAYEACQSTEDEGERNKFAKLHVQSLEAHIQGLSSKKYHLAEGLSTPDFVILFMPLEPAFALAFKEKPEIFQNAWEKNVAIVSPTTLLTTLRTVAALWRQEKQQKNAYEIARRGGLLYEKFSSLLVDLKVLGDRLDSSQKAYNDVLKKVNDGRGNLISQVEELKELGAKTKT